MNLICRFFGHKVFTLFEKTHIVMCERCGQVFKKFTALLKDEVVYRQITLREGENYSGK